MTDTQTMDARITTLRSELLGQVQELRQEMLALRRAMYLAPTPGAARRTREEYLAGIERLREFHDRVLQRRRGEPLPSSGEEIARMREERALQVLGE
ncbi:MAG TPA: hypothetical protein VFJ58_05175 [Armatimonadota bacterium]|nr:hypothetical protein [Armatimonadota bacterium]